MLKYYFSISRVYFFFIIQLYFESGLLLLLMVGFFMEFGFVKYSDSCLKVAFLFFSFYMICFVGLLIILLLA